VALLTEADVRRMSNHGTRGPVVVNRDQKLTPGAMDYLRDHRIEVVYPQGRPEESGPQEEGTVSPGKYQTLFGAVLQDKPEHMTHLKGNILVFKDHPRIAFRGWIDALEAEITLTQQAAAGEGFHTLAEELEEVLAVNRLRTLVRQVELAAYAAFRDPDGNVTRPDMILGLNRLSSLMWIMMIKLKAGSYARTTAESQSVFPHGGTVRQGGA